MGVIGQAAAVGVQVYPVPELHSQAGHSAAVYVDVERQALYDLAVVVCGHVCEIEGILVSYGVPAVIRVGIRTAEH